MDRRKRKIAPESGVRSTIEILDKAGMTAAPPQPGACCVCGTRDARLLMMVELRGGAAATLCGSHALLHSRMGAEATTVTELRESMTDRRSYERRAIGEGDELAEKLTAAFTRDRRGRERRAG
jgi:hypothetical protein